MRVIVSNAPAFLQSSTVTELLRRHHDVMLRGDGSEERVKQWVGVELFVDGDPFDALVEFDVPNEIRIAPNNTRLLTGVIYGPGDPVISPLIKMMRSLPIMPSIARSDTPFQPLWHEDLARLLATALERDDLRDKTIEVAGRETTTMDDVFERLAAILDRKPVRSPLPKVDLLEQAFVLAGPTMLTALLGTDPTPLQDGLRTLAHSMPEQMPEDGVGALEHKRFVARIEGSTMRAPSLMTAFRNSFAEIIPLDFTPEPHAMTKIERGTTLTMKLPLRGNAQVRVEALEPQRLTLATIDGHPMAGAVQFTTLDSGTAVEFAVDTYHRFANVLDLIATKTIGSVLQDANWKHVVQKAIDLSGGSAPNGVQTTVEKLDEDAAHEIEKRLRATIQARMRKESAEDAAQR